MEIPNNIDTYAFAPGTKEIAGIACRKHDELRSVSLPDGLETIGDAAFSHCTKLKKVVIPASVMHIGVAAFCKSGIEVATFLGIPKEIEPSVFVGCKWLVRVVVPNGTKGYFAKFFPIRLLQEADIHKPANPTEHPQATETDLFGQPIKKSCSLTYNFHDFTWSKGDKVDLNELFSGPTILYGDPSYQFRRKVLFIFVKDETVCCIPVNSVEYDLPANTVFFMRKYKEKYGARSPRIFVFTCNDGKNARLYDEVRFVKANKNTITIKSIIK